MKREEMPMLPGLVFTRYTQDFEVVDYTTPLSGPFDITTPLQAMMQEATAKGCVVVVNVALVPFQTYYGEALAEVEADQPGEQPG